MSNIAGPAGSGVAVIDLGSNTVLLLVLDDSGRVLCEASRITRLGQGVFETGRLSPQAADRTRCAVRELVGQARAAGVERVVGVGTEALRRARDGRGFLATLCGNGLLDEARVLTGAEEAAYAIEASRRHRAAPGSPLVVIDVGGGSTEIAWTPDGIGVRGVSLPLGSVRLTERFVRAHPPSRRALAEVSDAVVRGAAVLRDRSVAALGIGVDLVAVAGTATTLAALEQRLEPYDADAVEGFSMSRACVREWLDRLSQMSVEERLRLPGLEPGRADVIVAGLIILDGVLTTLRASSFRVSGRGVRHGVALQLLAGDGPV